ncbi:Mitochondrial genome maintenance exonuclease 1 [Bagarius yarrelli]|uniref:Mitochondrial genome maintenance exonuclease 1 n=1 Tax=Bagarius yarrelli TaxID=175774 RepID=A0A556VV73_BAGYA|nr:Mitochondrial genome maintenance exonuclease 1 [Bagarius yarrelli]
MRIFGLHSYCLSTVLSVRFLGSPCPRTAKFSSFPGLRSRKKNSSYSDVDSQHYSSLLKAVVSTRISSQTPETIENEDQWLYGSVIKSKSRMCRALRNPFPLVNDAKCIVKKENESITRIKLRRGSDHASIPSVTKILQKTMSVQQAFYLERWQKRMVAELGVEGFTEYTNNLFTQGKQFHVAVERILTRERNATEVCESLESVSGFLQSISHVLEGVTGVTAIESVVLHQPLQYLGIVDCVAVYKNSLCVIEWKTSEKPKPFLHNTYDNPLQVAAYIGALNSDRNYNYQVDTGLIVVAYKDGSPAHTHFLKADQVVQYWDTWLLRLEEYMENDE